MEDNPLVSAAKIASVQLLAPSLSLSANESCFSPPAWFTDACLNAMSQNALSDASGQAIMGPLDSPHGQTDHPSAFRTRIASSCNKLTMQNTGFSSPFWETDDQKPKSAPDSVGLLNAKHCDGLDSSRLCYECMAQPRADVITPSGLQDVQCVSADAFLSIDSCCSSEQKPSKEMQPLIANMESIGYGSISSENSPEENNAIVSTPESGFSLSAASCYDGNDLMGLNAPGTELSLAIASVVDSGTDQEAEVLHASFGMNACAVNNLAQISDNEKPFSKKDEMFFKLVQRVRELEAQLQERKEWACQKAMQAACKFRRDMSELSSLRVEHEEILRLKTDAQALEDSTMKRLTKMESALKKAGAQVEWANASVRKLEVENAELHAEMEAAKLNAAESNAMQQEVTKREKKSIKKVQAWEKQKSKLLADIAEEKKRITETQGHLSAVMSQQQEAEVRWRQEEKAKDEAVLLANAEKWAKEQLEIAARRKEELLRRKADANFQRYKDDVKRLESELGQFRLAAEAAQTCTLRLSSGPAINSTSTSDLQTLKDIYSQLLNELAELQESRRDVRRDHECVMCMLEQRSVVFLPCAHQIVCSNCSDTHEKQGMSDCPSCRTIIKERIHVFGASTT